MILSWWSKHIWCTGQWHIIFMVILNLCCICSETGQNLLKWCIRSSQKAKNGLADILRARFGPINWNELRLIIHITPSFLWCQEYPFIFFDTKKVDCLQIVKMIWNRNFLVLAKHPLSQRQYFSFYCMHEVYCTAQSI